MLRRRSAAARRRRPGLRPGGAGAGVGRDPVLLDRHALPAPSHRHDVVRGGRTTPLFCYPFRPARTCSGHPRSVAWSACRGADHDESEGRCVRKSANSLWFGRSPRNGQARAMAGSSMGRSDSMKLYVWNIAPNPRRVLHLSDREGDRGADRGCRRARQAGPGPEAFLEWAPHRRVPVLELDDGTLISEAMAICRYFETRRARTRRLMGADALEMARVEMWERMSEFEGLLAVAESFRNAKRSFAGRALPGIPGELKQIPELIERGKTARRALFRQAGRPARRGAVSSRASASPSPTSPPGAPSISPGS